MKRIILVHRWDGGPEADWYPWIKKELGKRKIKVEIPLMPEPARPEIDAWVSFLSRHVKKTDADTYFIGHSVGCQTILRYIETLPPEEKIGGVIFVAPWFTLHGLTTDDEREVARSWLTEHFNFEKVKKRKIPFVALFSDDDPFVPLDNADLFKNKLGAQIIIEKGQGHYTEITAPSVLQEVLKMLQLR